MAEGRESLQLLALESWYGVYYVEPALLYVCFRHFGMEFYSVDASFREYLNVR